MIKTIHINFNIRNQQIHNESCYFHSIAYVSGDCTCDSFSVADCLLPWAMRKVCEGHKIFGMLLPPSSSLWEAISLHRMTATLTREETRHGKRRCSFNRTLLIGKLIMHDCNKPPWSDACFPSYVMSHAKPALFDLALNSNILLPPYANGEIWPLDFSQGKYHTAWAMLSWQCIYLLRQGNEFDWCWSCIQGTENRL